MADPAPTTYDELPYLNKAFPQTHPDRLATLARLFALQPPPIDTCRVLELGCASGDNIIPMALVLPNARFLGIDLSGRQIEQGQRRCVVRHAVILSQPRGDQNSSDPQIFKIFT